MRIKAQTKVDAYYATGTSVPGIVLRQHDGESEWYVVRMTDSHGTFKQSVHRSQIVITDNRPNREV